MGQRVLEIIEFPHLHSQVAELNRHSPPFVTARYRRVFEGNGTNASMNQS